METTVQTSSNNVWHWILGLVVIIGAAWFLLSVFKGGEEWTLLVCETKLNQSECQDIGYTIPGFESAKECLLEGTARFQESGFECGSNCEVGTAGLQICKEICNASGCH